MIIRRLHLHPFAGAADREVAFAPGLNVVLGPNEAGKTTLRRALRQVLFVPTKLTKRQAEEEVSPFFPLSGGDTVRVSVDLETEGRLWKLTKRWASGNSSAELHLPDGGILSDGVAIEESLAGLRGLSQGTWEHVLIATQGEVGASLDHLGEPGSIDDLNAVMRRAVFETDGVSLEKLGLSIQARWNKIFSHWDRDLNRPEGNRGLERPWVKEVGSILKAYYERERADLALAEAETYYRRLDDLNARTSAASAESETLRQWVATHTAIARDTEQRAGLEGRLAQVEAKGTGLKQISQEWPVAESKRAEKEALSAQLKQKVATLATELERAKTWEAAGKTRALLEEADKRQVQVEAARKERDAAPVVEAAQIESLESLEKERDRLRARLEAASLKVVFRAAAAIELETRAGVGDSAAHSLAAGETLSLDAGGRVLVRHGGGDWELEVASGDIDVAAEEKRFREIEAEAADLLAKTGAPDLAAARTRRAVYQEKLRDFAAEEKQLRDLLGPSRTLEDLRAEGNGATGGSPEAPARNVGDLSGEHGRTEAEASAAEREVQTLRTRIDAWTRDYQSADALLDLLVDLRADHQKVKGQIEALLPLPDGCTDARTFLDEFRRRKDILDQRQAAMNQLLVEKASLEGSAPALEPSDAAEWLAVSTADFTRAQREGAAIDRIQGEFESLRAEMDTGTLDPWLAHLSEVVAPLTRDRYIAIHPDKGTASRDDSVSVPFDSLSTGTRACLGLAVRLSMARWFLEDSDGFLVLDDPLVDLDPDRQEAAAAILKHFAKDKQVILLTCHPGHAAILGGNTITL